MDTNSETFIDRLNVWLGRCVSWLSLVLVLIIIGDVFFRYAFSMTSSASFELEWHIFAVMFLLSAGWAFKADKHVRVDVFYSRFSHRNKAFVNLFGCIFLLSPLCVVGFLEGLQFTANAYMLGETSPDPGGLPGRFLVKSAIPIGFLLLGLQGISEIVKALKTIFKK
ncbi:MAG: TRAP transporter small permease subunit [Marinoscillum sp.]